MHYEIANFTHDENNPVIEFIAEIPEAEVNDLFDMYKYMTVYKQAHKLAELSVDNGIALQQYIKAIYAGKYKNEKDKEKLADTANRLTYNYCSSFGTLIDIYEKLLGKIDKAREKAFHSYTNELHSNNLEYRLFCHMRDYCVHYDFPYTNYSETEKEIELVCTRTHLLKFDGWKLAKNDIKGMDEKINLAKYIPKMNSLIYALFFDFLYHIADKIDRTSKIVEKLYDKYKPSIPFAIITLSNEQYDKIQKHELDLSADELKLNITEINIKLIKEAIDNLMRNPHVKVKLIQ